MNLYKISQEINNNWDTYDSCIVLAESEEDARNNNLIFSIGSYGSWVKESQKDKLKIELIGPMLGDHYEPQVLLSSFNAG